jgi:quinolinate synthase
VVIAHPECGKETAGCADELLSTSQMLSFVRDSSAKQFIVATEIGIIHTLQKENPDKEFIPASERAICPNMKKITLEKLLWSLEDMQYIITVPEETAAKAKKALDRMIAVTPAK